MLRMQKSRRGRCRVVWRPVVMCQSGSAVLGIVKNGRVKPVCRNWACPKPHEPQPNRTWSLAAQARTCWAGYTTVARQSASLAAAALAPYSARAAGHMAGCQTCCEFAIIPSTSACCWQPCLRPCALLQSRPGLRECRRPRHHHATASLRLCSDRCGPDPGCGGRDDEFGDHGLPKHRFLWRNKRKSSSGREWW